MYTIRATNVNEAFPIGILGLCEKGEPVESRNGPTLEIPEAASVMYENPCERILFDSVRDCNPFLGFFEALWILAGRSDVKFLADIVSTMANYSDDGKDFHGAYGQRMRNSGGDQIHHAIHRLKANPDDRQVVLTIREPSDLWYRGKDTPCNLMVDCKIRNNKLNIQVFNRSNDFIWGMLGTNVVQFSTLQEYMAGMIGCEVGHYHQTTSSMHVYVNDQWAKIKDHVFANRFPYDPYENDVKPYPMFATLKEPTLFDKDLQTFFELYDDKVDGCSCLTPYFGQVVYPMWVCLMNWKQYQKTREAESFKMAWKYAGQIGASDWRLAVKQWLNRRAPK